MNNLSTVTESLAQLAKRIIPDDVDSSLIIPERNQLGDITPAIVAWTEFDSEFKERTAFAAIIDEPEDRAIALSEATTQHAGTFTEDGYPMKALPYNERLREALRRAAAAALALA